MLISRKLHLLVFCGLIFSPGLNCTRKKTEVKLMDHQSGALFSDHWSHSKMLSIASLFCTSTCVTTKFPCLVIVFLISLHSTTIFYIAVSLELLFLSRQLIPFYSSCTCLQFFQSKLSIGKALVEVNFL